MKSKPDHGTSISLIQFQSALIILWTVVSTIFFGSSVIILSFISGGNTIHKIARLWAKSILLVSGIRVTVMGNRNIDPSQSCIYMSNHQSNYDIPVLLAYLDVQFRWIAKTELFRIPIFGLAMKKAEYISIDRSDIKSAIKSLNKAAETIRNGRSVVIFPEGTRSMDGNIHPFKKGGFVMAADARVPIVPVIIHGTYPIMPKNKLMIKPGHVLLEICPPIKTSDYSRKTKDALVERVRQVICARFRKDYLP